MINIIYAYKQEIKALKQLVAKNNLQSEVRFFKWPIALKNIEGLILNVGFAGSLNSDISLGRVVIIEKIFCEGNNNPVLINGLGQTFTKEFADKNGLISASLLTVKYPVTDSMLRDELWHKTNADVVDMEGYYLHNLAKEHGLPLVSFKVISDLADSNTIESALQKSGQWSNILGEVIIKYLKFYLECSEDILKEINI